MRKTLSFPNRLLALALPLLVCTGTLTAASNVERECLGLSVTPNVIQMGAFYHGASVKVEGWAENGTRVIVTVSGADSEERFNQKTRFGFIWINGGRIRVLGAPSLFMQFSSAPLCTLLPAQVIAQNRLDQNAILNQLRIQPPIPAVDQRLRSNFMDFKKLQDSYQFVDGGVVMAAAGNSGTPFSLTFHWPRTVPPGTYEVRLYQVKEGVITHQLAVSLRAVRIGLPAWLARLSMDQPVYYGLAAVVIAVLAGFGIDRLVMILFGKKPRIAH